MTEIRFFGDVPWQGQKTCLMTLMAVILLCAAFHVTSVVAADRVTPAERQSLFWQAKTALRSGDLPRFNRYASRLRDDPLYPYLLYWRLQRRLSYELPMTIEAFLQRYADLPLASSLRTSWLYQLAGQKRWEEYLDFYRESDDAVLRCHYFYARYKAGEEEAAWEGAKRLWLVGYSQDDACNPLFSIWEKKAGISRELRWQRIELVMERGDTELADHLAGALDEEDKYWLRLWQHAYRDPDLLRSTRLNADSEMSRRIIFHTLKFRAKRAPRGTMALWNELESGYRFSVAQQQAMARAIGIGLTYANDERALDWFARLPAEERDREVCNMAFRVALHAERWGSVLAWLEVMPEGENRSTRAMYWRGRAYEKMGFTESARYFFKKISGEPGYYGFLAADRLNLPYNLNDEPLSVSINVLKRVAFRPDIIRAERLYHLGLIGSARREWKQAVGKMDREELLAASKLASAWGWEDRALLTIARAEHFGDLNIRFPLSFNETVEKEARRRNIDAAWIYAVVRQESAMMPYVKSHVGALGLMQVMPATGREIAWELNHSIPSQRQLLKPSTNILYGSYYLRSQLERFDRNHALASAAYNAGPHRIRKWYPKKGAMDADIWVDTIPFDETRQYVRRVMSYAVFYDQRLKKPVKRLRERMPPLADKRRISGCDNCLGLGKKALLARSEVQ